MIASLYIGLGWLFLLHLADWMLVLPSAARFILSFATVLALPVLAIYLLFLRLRPADYRKISYEIEKAIPELKQEISTAVQFGLGKENRENYSQQLIADLIQRAGEKLKGIQGGSIFPVKALPLGKPTVYMLIVLVIGSLIRPSEICISLERYMSPDGVIGQWDGIGISPGDVRVARENEILVDVVNPGRTTGRIEWRGDANGSAPMTITEGKLAAKIKDIRTPLSYRILLGRRQSRFYRIDCYTPLLLSDIRLKITPPRYTGFQVRQMENQGDITAIRGSRVDISAVSTLPLEEARLLFDRSGQKEVAISEGRQLSVSFYIGRNEKYNIWGRTAQGDTFVNSAGYRITCLDDEVPEIEIIFPENDIMLGEGMKVSLIGAASDDFGLSAARLGYISSGRQKNTEINRWQKYPEDAVVEYVWDVGRLDVLPGDSVTYWLEALDNDAVSGPKLGRSRVQIIRVPTIEDIYRSLAQADSTVMEKIGQTEEPRNQLKEEIDKLAQSLKEARKIDWQQQAAAEQVLKKQQELAEQLEQALEQAAENLKQRENKWSFDPETMEKLAQLRELFDQVATDQMRQDMERLRQALDKLDKQEVGRALDNLKLSQEDFKRQLDQTMELLKELRQEQQMEKLDRQLQDLAQRQKDLKERTESRPNDGLNKRLSSEQKQLAEDLKKISNEMQELARELKESNREASQKLSENSDRLQQKQTGRKMEKASQSLSENNNSQAADLQKQVLSELSMISAGMQSARSSMRQAKNKAAAKAVQQRARDLLDLSRQQESLNQSAANAAANQNDLANQQQIIQRQAERIRRELDNMARNNMLLSPRSQQMMQEAARQMGQAAQAHSEGRGDQAQKGGQKALASLNGAAISLMESSGSSGGGSGDMMQDLSGLSGQQQAVNQGTSSLLPMPQEGGGQMSQQARSRMSRLAAQQEAVRQGMEEFGQKYGGRRDKAGRLDNLVEEMKQVIEDLKKQQVSRQTIERQEKILTRMLDAQQSLKERDFSRERQAESGRLPENSYRPPNTDKGKWTPQGLPAWKNWRQEYYPLEYKEILEEYFRLLGQ
ncbi:MAG: hypothetical protein KJ620_06485 [Candidatus Edwardsbacteria bacterium]|nr:hypothetical protein [Candidatus Edwardsbacteria bacterium]MBU1576723.1 hypothetical protein [Candidatus Edwardsbacteria bacterium]MBU2464507.1 hypothetical protein [Candidatus Edwardsbacteria bacterium]MBU2594810.1 hypothetical protein [Candidatus Edwardsbacteria bacterium]